MLRAAIKRARIRHPNLLSTRVTRDDKGEPRLEVEPCRAPKLRDVLAKGPLGLDASARLVSDVAAAAEELSRHGMIARDLRPETIFMDRERGAILADLAALPELVPPATDEPQARRLYRSPEERICHPPDGRSTVYSLGALFITAATGQLPPEQFESRAGNGNTSIPALERVVERAMSPDPAERYLTPIEFVRALLDGIHEHKQRLPSGRADSRGSTNGAEDVAASRPAERNPCS
jgi:serine/threonine protein kinase